jgi:hypothetical protein
VKPNITLSHKIEKMRDAAIAALQDAPVFVRSGQLVDLVEDRIRETPVYHLRCLLSEYATWLKPEKGGASETTPPLPVAQTILAASQWPGIRPLKGIVTAPCLRPDGSILCKEGYDEALQLYSLARPPYPAPSIRLKEAVEALLEVVCDFPFGHEAGKSAWLAGLLTLVARPAISGPVPLFLIDGNCQGVGKGNLADCAGIIAYGKALPRTAQGKDAEEDNKTLLGLALQGVNAVLWDNIDRPFGSSAIDMTITSGEVRGRILGSNNVPAIPSTLIHWLTGNNVRIRGDLARRSIRISLVTKEERPELRFTFRHFPLLPWVTNNRTRLLGAALGLLQMYCRAGRPAPPKPLGSFEAWSDLIRGCIMWAGLPDPLLCNTEDRDDEDLENLADLLAGWEELCAGDAWLGVSSAVERLSLRIDGRWATPASRLRAALGSEVVDTKRLTSALRKYRDRVHGGKALMRVREKDARGWKVVNV